MTAKPGFREWMLARPLWVISALVLVVYSGTFRNGFTGDDFLVVAGNRFVQSASNLPRLFTRDYITTDAQLIFAHFRDIGSGESSYRPVVTLSYFFDHALWGLRPAGYHLTSLIIHLAAAWLVFFFLRRLSGRPDVALLASLLFALHPANTEPVYAIGYREDLLALAAMMAAFLLQPRSSAGSAFFFLAALYSKESAIVFPALLAAEVYFFGPAAGDKSKSSWLGRHGWYAAAAVLYLTTWLGMTGDIRSAVSGGSVLRMASPEHLFSMLRSFGVSIEWLIFPARVHLTISEPASLSTPLFSPQVIFPTLLLIVVICLIVTLRRTQKQTAFALLWVLVSLVPASGIVPLRQSVAARYLYVASVGYCYLIAHWIFKLPRRAAAYTMATLLIFYGVFSMIRSGIYQNNLGFWSEMVEAAPGSGAAHAGMAEGLLKAGAVDEAIHEYEIAVTLSPSAAQTRAGLGAAYLKKRQFEKAAAAYREAIHLGPNLIDAYLGLGDACGELGRYADSEGALTLGISRQGDYAPLHAALGVTYARMKEWGKARRSWERALALDPAQPGIRTDLRRLEELEKKGAAF